MEHYQDQYGNATRKDDYGNPVSQTEQYGNPVSQTTDQYGNPVSQTTDQYGNPVHHTGSTGYGSTPYGGGATGATGYGTTTGTTTGHHGLHRSGSSSSEDEVDEHGVRRKKGMKEKIREKIPGAGGGHGHAGHGHGHAGHGYDQSHTTSTTTPGGYQTATGEHHEKKGIMDKIKEKLPGNN